MDPRNAAENLPNAHGATPPLSGSAAAQAWRFDDFEFDGRRGELRGRDGQVIALRPKAELLLRQFLAHPGRLLSRDELMGAVWPNTVVTDDSLVQCVVELRAALADAGPRLIRTLPKRGYRFEATVAVLVDLPERPASAKPAAGDGSASLQPTAFADARWRSSWRRKPGVLVVLGLALAAALGGVVQWGHRPAPLGIDATLVARSTLAVMPFVIQEGQPQLHDAANAFADGIVAQMATRRPAGVLGRTATAAFDAAAPPLARMAEVLRATHVVTGHVGLASEPGRLSIDVQLTQIENREVFWARHFESGIEARDSMAQTLGQQVFNAMLHHMVRGAGIRAQRPGQRADPADLALLGWDDLDRRQSLADVWRARQRFEAALRADPGSVVAMNGLAATYSNEQADSKNRMTPEQISEGERITEAVHRLAPDDATALMLWGSMQMRRGRADLALPALQKAVLLVPSHPNGHVLLAQALLMRCRLDEVQAITDHAVALGEGDARRTSMAFLLAAEAATMRGDDGLAEDLARRAVAEFPSNSRAHSTLAAIEALAGREAASAQEMATFLRLRPTATLANYDRLNPSTDSACKAERARFYQGLRKAGLPER